MPRDGSGVYHRPLGVDAVSDTTIESSKYNNNVLDVELDLNTPRPIVAGGTAATSADGALDSFSAEKFGQLVTNWDATPLRAGSVYAPITVLGTTPVAAHAFAGICYYANATDLVLDVTDLTAAASLTCNQYIRVMTAGVWGPWIAKGGSGGSGTKTMAGYDYIYVDNNLLLQQSGPTIPPITVDQLLKPGQITFDQDLVATDQAYIFISHITNSGTNLAKSIPDSVRMGYNFHVNDAINPATTYMNFTVTSPADNTLPPYDETSDFFFRIRLNARSGTFVSGRLVQVTTSLT